MNSKSSLERLIYAAVIILSLAALALAVVAGAAFQSTKLVYQGF